MKASDVIAKNIKLAEEFSPMFRNKQLSNYDNWTRNLPPKMYENLHRKFLYTYVVILATNILMPKRCRFAVMVFITS